MERTKSVDLWKKFDQPIILFNVRLKLLFFSFYFFKKIRIETKNILLSKKIKFCQFFPTAERKGGRQEEDDGGDSFEIDQRPMVSIMRHPSDRRTGESVNNVTFAAPDLNDSNIAGAAALISSESRSQNRRRDSCKSKSAPVSVSRSESYKERTQRKNQREKRKTSDPSLGKDM